MAAVPELVRPVAGTPAPRRREAPLGRAALWFCLGLGAGILACAVLVALSGPIRFLAEAPPGVRVLALAWPVVLIAAAASLLHAGTMAACDIAVPRAEAETLLRTGAAGLARIRRVHVERLGSQRLVRIALDARRRSGSALRSRLTWLLEPLDAEMLARGSVIPVRFDAAAPQRMVFDVRADSREHAAGIDVEEEFSPRGILRARLRSVRASSCAALALGLAVGAVTVLTG